MKWRNPKEELPKQDDVVWVMLKPHKWRGSNEESIQSIQIVCGNVNIYENGDVFVLNHDELGLGSQCYELFLAKDSERDSVYNDFAVAWAALEDMGLPSWTLK